MEVEAVLHASKAFFKLFDWRNLFLTFQLEWWPIFFHGQHVDLGFLLALLVYYINILKWYSQACFFFPPALARSLLSWRTRIWRLNRTFQNQLGRWIEKIVFHTFNFLLVLLYCLCSLPLDLFKLSLNWLYYFISLLNSFFEQFNLLFIALGIISYAWFDSRLRERSARTHAWLRTILFEYYISAILNCVLTVIEQGFDVANDLSAQDGFVFVRRQYLIELFDTILYLFLRL